MSTVRQSSAAMNGASHSKQQQQLHQPSRRGKTVISVRTTPHGRSSQTKLAEGVGTRRAERCPPSSANGNQISKAGVAHQHARGTRRRTITSKMTAYIFASDPSSCVFTEPEQHGFQEPGEESRAELRDVPVQSHRK